FVGHGSCDFAQDDYAQAISRSRGMTVARGGTRMAGDYRKGFADQTREISMPSLEVEGVIPGWLSGTLLRNGPARFRLEDRTLNHWFDGFAMLHKFYIADGHVSYANRFLDSPAYRA